MAQGIAHIAKERYRTRIEVGGHALTADEPESLGGKNLGPAPFDLLLASLGACTSITLKMYAEKKEWPLESLAVALKLSGGKDDRRIDRVLTIVGLDEEQKAKLVDVAERTPVTLTLKGGLPIETHLA